MRSKNKSSILAKIKKKQTRCFALYLCGLPDVL